MAEIVISEEMEASAVDLLRRDFDVRHGPALWRDPVALAAALDAARALIVRNRTQIDAALLAQAPRLRAVGRLGVGLDNIDLAACEARGIAVLPARGANARSVAEYVVTCVLLLARGAYFANHRVIAGEWPRMALVGGETAGKTLGLVGFGSIGQVTAELAAAVGLRVLAHDPVLGADDPAWRLATRASFDAVIEGSDAVSLHVPLTPQTRGLIGAAEIDRMRAGALLINTARGGIVDETALIEALRAGRLGGAALDVFADEPLGAETGARFCDVPNLILTPHIAGISVESNARVSRITAEHVKAALTAG